MALVLAYADAKARQFRREDPDRPGRSLRTPFFGSRDKPDLPLATMNRQEQGRFSSPHFHVVDQFQVILNGKGKLGRHKLSPYCVHFSRAYTPYGPLVSDIETGLEFFVLRAHPDTGSQRLPKELDQLRRAPNRQPFQITREVTFPTLQPGMTPADMMLQAIPGIKDEKGLAAYTLIMKHNTKAYAPDPSRGDGQYLVVLKGSLWQGNNEHEALALVFVYPHEGAFQIHAGAKGLEALVLNFPSSERPAIHKAMSAQSTADFKSWKCTLCEFVYDEAAGLPEEGIAPGTRWKDVPETWTCPDCSSSKGDFQMIELQN